MTAVKDAGAVVIDVRSNAMLNASLQKRVRELAQTERSHILLDLANLTELDSRGVGELVVAHISVTQAGGCMGLLHVAPRVREMLQWCGLSDVLSIEDDETAIPMEASLRSEVYLG